MLIQEEEFLSENLRAIVHNAPAHEFLPEGEVLPFFVVFEEGDVPEFVEHFDFAFPLLDGHEDGLIVHEMGDPPRTDGHVFLLVPLLKLHNLPIVGVDSLVQVAEFIRHFRVCLYQMNKVHRGQKHFLLLLFLSRRLVSRGHETFGFPVARLLHPTRVFAFDPQLVLLHRLLGRILLIYLKLLLIYFILNFYMLLKLIDSALV